MCRVPSAHRALARTSVARRSPPFQPFSLLHLSWLGRGGKEGGGVPMVSYYDVTYVRTITATAQIINGRVHGIIVCAPDSTHQHAIYAISTHC